MCSRWSNSRQLDRFPLPSVLRASCGDIRWGCGSENSCVGVCPKLLMIASICVRSLSSSIFSKLTLSGYNSRWLVPHTHTFIPLYPIPHTPYPHRSNNCRDWWPSPPLGLSACSQRSGQSSDEAVQRHSHTPGGIETLEGMEDSSCESNTHSTCYHGSCTCY